MQVDELHAINISQANNRRRLFAAVIQQALDDAARKPGLNCSAYDIKAARAWFRDNSRDFQRICTIAGLDSDAVRERALAHIEEYDRTNKRPWVQQETVKTYRLTGKDLTFNETVKALGMDHATLTQYLAEDWSPDELARGAHKRIAEIPRETQIFRASKKQEYNSKRYTAHGKTLTIPQWSALLGVKAHTLRLRIRKGVPLEEALSSNYVGRAPHAVSKYTLTYLGRTMALCEWAAEYGLPYFRVLRRYHNGCTPEEILSSGSHSGRPKAGLSHFNGASGKVPLTNG